MVSSGDTDPPTTKQIPQAKHTSSKLSPVKKAGRSGLFSADFTPKSMTTPPQAGNWDLSKVLTIASQADDDAKRSGKDDFESGNPVFRECFLCVEDDTLDFPQDIVPLGFSDTFHDRSIGEWVKHLTSGILSLMPPVSDRVAKVVTEGLRAQDPNR